MEHVKTSTKTLAPKFITYKKNNKKKDNQGQSQRIQPPKEGKNHENQKANTEISQSLNKEVPIPELEEWDPTSLPDHFFMVLEGKRRTGKSTFAKWLLQYYQDKFSLVWVMTHTKSSGFWQEFVGSQFVFDGWSSRAIHLILQRNDKIVTEYGEDSDISKKMGSTLIILDDCIEKDIFYDPAFINLAVEGRHHLLSIIFVTQDPKTVCPKVRDNSDVAVVFNLKTFRNKESIWHDFMNDVTKDEALGLLEKHCVDHNCLVCVQTNLNSDIKKNFYKSVGDKTKLEDPEYLLGDETQKEMTVKEREVKKLKKEAQKGLDKNRKVPQELEGQNFTIDKTLKNRNTNYFDSLFF